jgi:hypothetical protein
MFPEMFEKRIAENPDPARNHPARRIHGVHTHTRARDQAGVFQFADAYRQMDVFRDQVCRAGVSFRYTAEGPAGLLTGKRADIVITTGGAPPGSPADFVSSYLRQVFGFIGIDEVEIIGADGMNQDAGQSIARAHRQIEQRYPALTA